MNPSREVLASADRYPGQISWDYDRAEIIADGVVHAIGLSLGLIGAVTIAVIAVRIERVEVAPILIYTWSAWSRCSRSRPPTTVAGLSPPSGLSA
jgi:predicted membrane channel-forming protein YqfA (hemolysin III family)